MMTQGISPAPSVPPAGRRRLCKADRLRTAAQFRLVYGFRRSVADDCLIVYGRPNDVGRPRLGISAGRKLGTAVVRNRLKRLCREAFRLERDPAWGPVDLVLIPRTPHLPDCAMLRESLRRLVPRLVRLLQKGRP